MVPHCFAHKRIYVFGAESSGTRYMSSGVAKLFDSTIEWSGYIPACRYINRDVSIQHVSLPSNGRCNGNIVVIPTVDKCEKLPTEYRWFANVTNILTLDKDAVAIVISRDGYFTKRSIAKNHCSMEMEVVEKEFDTANKIINHAIETFPERVLLVSYEILSLFPSHEWHRVENFLGIKRQSNYKPFKNGNK